MHPSIILSQRMMTCVIITSSFELQIKHQTIDADVRVSHNLFLVKLYAFMIYILLKVTTTKKCSPIQHIKVFFVKIIIKL